MYLLVCSLCTVRASDRSAQHKIDCVHEDRKSMTQTKTGGDFAPSWLHVVLWNVSRNDHCFIRFSEQVPNGFTSRLRYLLDNCAVHLCLFCVGYLRHEKQ